MNLILRLRIQFIAVFMAVMVVAAGIIGVGIWFRERSELEYQSMVYLLDIHNYGNIVPFSESRFAGYPPYFVIEIDNTTDTSEVVLGDFFLEQQGVTTDELIVHLAGMTEQSDVLKEYGVRYFNGVREEGRHRVSFIDVTYIDRDLARLPGRIALIALPVLAALAVAAFFLSKWFARPAVRAMSEQRDFISKISHELKTPLSIISANIDLIDGDRAPDGADFAFGCDNIRHECGRMTAMIEAMLWASRPAKTKPEELQDIDMSRLLEGEALRFEVLAFDRGLTMTTQSEPGLRLRGDETLLTRLVDIILDNAVKYCSPGGAITLSAAGRPGRHVRIVCSNTGEEIGREHLDKLFRPFYQADPTRKGAGLGLSIAKEIVNGMNGSIRVDYADGQNRFVLEL